MPNLRIAPAPGAYPSGTPVSITASEPNAVIFYTLDGSPPSSMSKRYRHPIRLGPETTKQGRMRLRALAVAPDGRQSTVVGMDFERTPGMAIRFRKPATWSSASIHYWGTEPDAAQTRWPGQAMSRQEDGWYRFDLPGCTRANLVFSDAGGAQTRDLRADCEDVWFVGDERWECDPARWHDFLFPGGLSKCLVVSMDDGRVQDRRLIALLNRYGIRGTFHLNSGKLGHVGYVDADEVASLYAGHEVSTHAVTHPYLTSLARQDIISEIADDRAALTRIAGQDVRGHAYPFGAFDGRVIEVLQALGIAYARTAIKSGGFELPGDPLAWKPSCHHSAASGLVDAFFSRPDSEPALFFVYGHSYEFDSGAATNNWGYMASLAETLSGRSDTWYATALQVADHLRAMRRVCSSLAADRLLNPGDQDLWLRARESCVRLPAGGSVEGVFGG